MGDEPEFVSFCRNNYIADSAELDKVFNRISLNFEVIFGYFNTISVDLAASASA